MGLETHEILGVTDKGKRICN